MKCVHLGTHRSQLLANYLGPVVWMARRVICNWWGGRSLQLDDHALALQLLPIITAKNTCLLCSIQVYSYFYSMITALTN